MIKRLLVLLLLLVSVPIAAQISLFAEHQSMHLTAAPFYSDDLYIDGYYPQRNEIGVEYKPNHLSYRVSFIDASSGDNRNSEYNHQGITLGIKYCLAYCK